MIDSLWPTRLALNLATAILGSESDAVACVIDAQEQIANEARSKLRAHVRTGTYRGTIERRIRGLMREMPRAETLCGGEATSKDHTLTSARQTIRDASEPFLSDMCPACRTKLEVGGARDLSSLPARSGSSTVKQRSYLRRLLDEGARSGRPYLVEARGIDQMSSRSASAAIDKLRALKERSWKGDL